MHFIIVKFNISGRYRHRILVLPNVTEGSAVFYNCTQLQSANLERWNPTKIVNLPWLFYGCENLQEFSLDGWRVPSLLSLQQAFSSCTKLEVIDLSSWTEIHSLNSLYGTFQVVPMSKKLEYRILNPVLKRCSFILPLMNVPL